MSWSRPRVGFFEPRTEDKAAMAAEYDRPAAQSAESKVIVSEENLSAISRLRYIADKIERGENVDHEIDYLLSTKLIRDWQDKQPKGGNRSGWGNV
jgi:hypothetical protein